MTEIHEALPPQYRKTESIGRKTSNDRDDGAKSYRYQSRPTGNGQVSGAALSMTIIYSFAHVVIKYLKITQR